MNNKWIYFCNSSYLNNKYIDDIIGKKNIYSELDETLKKDLNFNNLIKTSILNLFNDIVYKLIYFYILKIDYDFKRFIPYEFLFEYSSINKLKR